MGQGLEMDLIWERGYRADQKMGQDSELEHDWEIQMQGQKMRGGSVPGLIGWKKLQRMG